MSAEQDFGDLADFLALALAASRQLDIVQASDGAAIDAKKMGMNPVAMIAGHHRFETPNVIAQFGATQQTGLGHVVQIAESRRLINAARRQEISHIGVR